MTDQTTPPWLRPVGDPERGLYVELREAPEYPWEEGRPQAEKFQCSNLFIFGESPGL